MQFTPDTATPEDAEILGLEFGDTDPVRIILAAQLRLRGFRRRFPRGVNGQDPDEVRRIIAARDALLKGAVGTLTRRGLGRPTG